MKVFVSWSKERSRLMARALYGWSRYIIQAVEPWMSEAEIQAGQRWGNELAVQLSESHFGIICVTPENVSSSWLLFEAGALAKSLTQGRVVPLLLGLRSADLEPPLAQFQSVEATREGIEQLFVSLYHTLGTSTLTEDIVRENINAHWPKLQAHLDKLSIKERPQQTVVRADRDLLEEILTTVRGLQRTQETPPEPQKMVWFKDVYEELKALAEDLNYRDYRLELAFGVNRPESTPILDRIQRDLDLSRRTIAFIEGILMTEGDA